MLVYSSLGFVPVWSGRVFVEEIEAVVVFVFQHFMYWKPCPSALNTHLTTVQPVQYGGTVACPLCVTVWIVTRAVTR